MLNADLFQDGTKFQLLWSILPWLGRTLAFHEWRPQWASRAKVISFGLLSFNNLRERTLTQLFVNCDWFNSIPQWQRTKFWRPINHYSHWKNTLVWWYYLRRDSAWFCAVWQESGMNLFWIHSINDAGKLQKLLPFESYEGKCKGQLASNTGFKIWFALF